MEEPEMTNFGRPGAGTRRRWAQKRVVAGWGSSRRAAAWSRHAVEVCCIGAPGAQSGPISAKIARNGRTTRANWAPEGRVPATAHPTRAGQGTASKNSGSEIQKIHDLGWSWFALGRKMGLERPEERREVAERPGGVASSYVSSLQLERSLPKTAVGGHSPAHLHTQLRSWWKRWRRRAPVRTTARTGRRSHRKM